MRRLSSSLVLVATVLAAAGCSGSKHNPVRPVPIGIPDSVALATTPANLLKRFEAAFEFEVPAEWLALVSDDFRFIFSTPSDPVLVAEYGETWGRAYESAAMTHLFAGFTNEMDAVMPKVASATVFLGGASIIDDPDHPDSTAHYKRAIVPSLDATLVLADAMEFQIVGAQDLHLVRGDAAVLAAGQEARSDRWYVRRWVDKTAPLAVVAMPAGTTSWGRLRALYRR